MKEESSLALPRSLCAARGVAISLSRRKGFVPLSLEIAAGAARPHTALRQVRRGVLAALHVIASRAERGVAISWSAVLITLMVCIPLLRGLLRVFAPP